MVLFYFHEMDLAAAARTMGLPEGTMKARLSRARALLRKRFPHLNERKHAEMEMAALTPERRLEDEPRTRWTIRRWTRGQMNQILTSEEELIPSSGFRGFSDGGAGARRRPAGPGAYSVSVEAGCTGHRAGGGESSAGAGFELIRQAIPASGAK